MRLAPDPVVTPAALTAGQRALVRDGAWASLAGSLHGGVVLVGFALALGATPFVIGLLAAVPFLAQAAQLPAILLVERVRQRRKVAVLAVAAARTVIFSLALIPLLLEPALALMGLVLAHIAIATMGSVCGCALNSWMHQLLPQDQLGAFFARKLFWATAAASLGAIVAGRVVEHWPRANEIEAYAALFAAAGVAGMVSTWYLAHVPEPQMHHVAAREPLLHVFSQPLRDGNFRRLVIFMASWNFASNLAAPFLAVYLLEQLGLGLATVTALWVTSQLSNALTLYLWGRLSDRISNKPILAVAVPAYLTSILALAFTAVPGPHVLTLPLIIVLHVILGVCAGGVALAAGNMGLKLAPQGQGTVYLAATSLSAALAAGVSALVGGALAQWFSARSLSLTFTWSSPGVLEQMTVLQFRHWEFLFALSFLAGMYVLHALSRIEEGVQVSERVVIQQFVAEAMRSIDQLSSVESLRVTSLVPFGELIERRWRAHLRRRARERRAARRREGAVPAGVGEGSEGDEERPLPQP